MSTRNADRTLYATVFVLVMIEFLQSGMTAFAAGPIMGEVGITPEDFSLIAAIYASIAIFSISMERWFVERIGGRRFIQCASAIMAIGAVLCATSYDFDSFLLGRAVMALGGGALFTSARMIPHHLLAGPKRFVGIRFLAAGVALGVSLAPWVASVAVAHETWSAMYWLVAALDGMAFLLAGVALPNDPVHGLGPRSEYNLWHQLLLVGGSFLLLYALQRLYYDFYGDLAIVAVTLVAASLGLLAYARRQVSNERPLLRIRQMLHLRYMAGLALFLFCYAMLGANNYMVPVMLQRTLGYAWETVGHFEALGLGASVLTAMVTLRLLPRYPSPRKFLAFGFFALGMFGLLLSRIDTSANLWRNILPALVLNAVFLLTVLPVAAMQTFRETEYDESVFANAQQLKNMLAQAGIAVGITLATLGQQWRTAVHYTVLNAQVNPHNPLYVATIQQLEGALSSTMGASDAARVATARVAQMLAQQAAMLANIDHFAMIAVLGGLGIAATLVQRVFR
jgi:predicted MFS family arabinose efflux permease